MISYSYAVFYITNLITIFQIANAENVPPPGDEEIDLEVNANESHLELNDIDTEYFEDNIETGINSPSYEGQIVLEENINEPRLDLTGSDAEYFEDNSDFNSDSDEEMYCEIEPDHSENETSADYDIDNVST